jgi:putative sigma-54 modulation protein
MGMGVDEQTGGSMRIEYTGRQLEVPAPVRALAERKLRKLERILPGITNAHVTLRADRHGQTAEVVVHSRHLDLTATEAGADIGASLKAALEKLLHQAQRRRGRRRDLVRRAVEQPAARPAPPGERAVKVIRSRGFVAKPMTMEEALLEMEARREGPLVFRDAEGSGVRVLYWRRDGNLGLIEPEA